MWKSIFLVVAVMAMSCQSALALFSPRYGRNLTLKLLPSETLRQNIILGSRAEVTCQSHTSHLEMSYGLRWIGPNGEELSYNRGYDADIRTIGERSDGTLDSNETSFLRHELVLIIPAFREQHSGIYRCHGEFTTFADSEHRYVWVLLSATANVTWSDCPPEQKLELGASGVDLVKCAATSGTVPTSSGTKPTSGSSNSTAVSVTWFKNDQPFKPDGKRCRTVPDGIKCDPVEIDDAGLYVCFAGNMSDHGRIAGRRVTVEVVNATHVRPSITDVKIVSGLPDNGTVEVLCLAIGTPPPVLRWLDSSLNELTNRTGIVVGAARGALSLHRSVVDTLINIYCSAVNTVGEDRRDLLLLWHSDEYPHLFTSADETPGSYTPLTNGSGIDGIVRVPATTPPSENETFPPFPFANFTDFPTTTGSQTTTVPSTTTTLFPIYVTTSTSTKKETTTIVSSNTITKPSNRPSTEKEVMPSSTTTVIPTAKSTSSPFSTVTPETVIAPTKSTPMTTTSSTPASEKPPTTTTTTTTTSAPNKMASTTPTNPSSESTEPSPQKEAVSVTDLSAASKKEATDAPSGGHTGTIVGVIVFLVILLVVVVDVGLYVRARRGVLVLNCVRLCPRTVLPSYRKWNQGEEPVGSDNTAIYYGVADDGDSRYASEENPFIEDGRLSAF